MGNPNPNPKAPPIDGDWLERKRAALKSRSSDDLWDVKLSEKQRAFVESNAREVLFGGAAGGGKSYAIVAAAIRDIKLKGYNAILFRRTYPELTGADGLVEIAQKWLTGVGKYNSVKHLWTFPQWGSRLEFSHMQHEKDRFSYRGLNYHFVGFDEATQFTPAQYLYLFSRQRNTVDNPIPLRMRGATNPGGVSHEFFKNRFITNPDPDCQFIPSTLHDNPGLDHSEYERSLRKLDDPVEIARLLDGDWDAHTAGDFFTRSDFQIIDATPKCTWVRYWDMAASEKTDSYRSPDYTAGAKLGCVNGMWYLVDMVRLRGRPDEAENLVKATAEADGPGVAVRMEEESGASGKIVTDHYARRVLPGYDFQGIRSTGDKRTRAKPVASAAANGNFFLLRGDWNEAFLSEAAMFPGGSHDDQIDAVSGAMAAFRENVAETTVTVGQPRRVASLRTSF